MPRKRGLGRGLDALIPTDPEQQPQVKDDVWDATRGGLVEVPVDAVQPNPRQPRFSINENELAELAASIREHGLIQPLIVTRLGPLSSEESGYQLIAGERRWRAAHLAGLARVPVVVKEAAPQEILELALVENLQRADLNPLEEAQAYRQLIDEFGLTQEQVATRVGKSRVAVTNTLRLLRAPQAVQQALLAGEIHEGHARALLTLETAAAQEAALVTVVKQGLNVRQTEALVRHCLPRQHRRRRPWKVPSAKRWAPRCHCNAIKRELDGW
jgi:ParB family chromosome partitioning protein